jgi:pseudaminic acid cytidylyltransferase
MKQIDCVAVVTARGGSKRIPGKNIKPFLGKPMIAYSIETAKKSRLFDKIIVSTDDDRIASVAIEYGAEVPFRRPANLADDFTPTAPVVLDALEQLEGLGITTKYVCCIYPTAPFLTVESLRQGLDLMRDQSVTGSFAVTTYPHPIFRALRVNKAGRLEMFWPEHKLSRSNDLPEAFHDVGQFYWRQVEAFRRDQSVWAPDAAPVVVPRKRAQDIDTPEDWEVAELLYGAMQGS